MLENVMIGATPFLWLILGGALRIFDFGRRTIPLAAWLAPVFLLHFARLSHPLTGVAAVWMGLYLAALIAYRGVIPVPGGFYPLIVALLAFFWALPYLADRLLAAHLPGFASTLVFPLAWVVVEFITARKSPFGTWGSVAYTQYGHLPLMQLASVTGLWGITFLVTWFGSMVNWAWDNGFDWGAVQAGVLAYGITWGCVLLAGGARLAFTRTAKTVRAAAIGWPEGVLEPDEFMRAFMPAQLSNEARDGLRNAFCELQEYFLDRTRWEARTGAKIIMWPEINLMVFQEDEASFMQRARRLAREEGIYLLMGIGAIRPEAARTLENKAVLLDMQGEIVYSYRKNHPVPGWEAAVALPGDGRIVTHDSEYGWLASPICYDMDFPHFIRQFGQAGVDTLLVPASDTEPIKKLHHAMAAFRAVENGTSLVRANRWGVSAAVDPYGRTLALVDNFSAQRAAMVAQVPVSGVRTIYVVLGDWFAWLCTAGLTGMTAWAALCLV